jgi:hypothetical protein
MGFLQEHAAQLLDFLPQFSNFFQVELFVGSKTLLQEQQLISKTLLIERGLISLASLRWSLMLILPVHAFASCTLSTFIHRILSCISLRGVHSLRIAMAVRSYQKRYQRLPAL